MELRQLRTFRAVAELGSLSKASDRLRIALPALSRQIKLLEHELRAELFVRNGRGMILTATGRMLLDRVGTLVRQIEQVRDDVQSFNGAPSGRVILGMVPTVSYVLSARFAKRVVQELPDVSLRIVESYGGHLTEWLHRGEIDLSIIYGPAEDLHLAVEPLGRDQLVAVGPIGSSLAERGQVEVEWLAQQPLVLPSHSHGLRALIEKAMARKNLTPKVLVEADSFRVLTNIVQEGVGLTILPPSAVRAEVQQGKLETAAIIKPSISRELIFASPIDHPPSVATAAVAALIRNEMDALIDEGLWDFRKSVTAEAGVERSQGPSVERG